MNAIKTLKKVPSKVWDLFNSNKLTAAAEKKHKQHQLKLVAMAHEEFNTAQEKILADAKLIINNPDIIQWQDRLNVLIKMKFTQSSEFNDLTKKIEDYNLGEFNNEVYQYFNLWYPNYKIIHRDQVESICEKYGLLVGETSLYRGSIPQKNIDEMAKFKMKIEDYPVFQRICKELRYRGKLMTILTRWEVVSTAVERNQKIENSFLHPNDTELCISGYFGDYDNQTERRYSRSPRFLICAPSKDMDMQNKRLVGPWIIDDDPIVLLQIAQDFFLIITAWGPEASDPVVVNQRFN